MSPARIIPKTQLGTAAIVTIITTAVTAYLALLCIAPNAASADNTRSTAYPLDMDTPYGITLESDYDFSYWFEVTTPETGFYDFTGINPKRKNLTIEVFTHDAVSDNDYIAYGYLDELTEKSRTTALCEKGNKYYVHVTYHENEGDTFTIAVSRHVHSLQTSDNVTSCKTCKAQLRAEIDGNRFLKYTGKALTPKVSVTDYDFKKVPSSFYKVTYSKNLKPGTATATITGKGPYAGIKTSDTFYISMAKQKVKVIASKTLKASKLKKKAQSFGIYKAAKGKKGAYISKYVTKRAQRYMQLSSAGKLTVAKGTPKGTYKLKVYASAAGNVGYEFASVTKTIKVVVK